jgi:hypothetical protein
MAAKGYRNPPVFGDQDDYETWKNELKMWQLVTDLDVKKQALAVTLLLKGQAKAIALEIDSSELHDANGMTTLLKTLDKAFQKDETDIAYSVYTNFESLQRLEGQSMSEYIVEFERLYNLCRKHNMELPDAVLSFKILDKAGLPQKDKQLELIAANDLNFQNMKSALKQIFGECRLIDSATSDYGVTVKQESAMYTNPQSARNGNARRNYNRGCPQYQNNTQNSNPKGTNPLDRQGRRTKCAICGSIYHWTKDCEH